MTSYTYTCYRCEGANCDVKDCDRSGAYLKSKDYAEETKRLREELASFLEE